MCSRVNRTFIDTASTARSVTGVPSSPASLLKRAAKIALAELTPLRVPLAGLGVALLATGLPVFPAAALEVTFTMSDETDNSPATYTATVVYDTADIDFHEVSGDGTLESIRYFPAKMTFTLLPSGGTVEHERVNVIFERDVSVFDKSHFAVTNDVLDGGVWTGTLNTKTVVDVILKFDNTAADAFVPFDPDRAFDFDPTMAPEAGRFFGGANVTLADGSRLDFDASFYSFVERETGVPNPVFVNIDIKPGSDPNSINLSSGGATPVAILGDGSLDLEDIVLESLMMGTAGIKTVGKRDPKLLCSIEDVSGDFSGGPEGIPDGFDDLVCHFITVGLVDEEGATEATLVGDYVDDLGSFTGTDSVNIVP